MKQLYTNLSLVTLLFIVLTAGCKCHVGGNEVKDTGKINFKLKKDIKEIVDGIHNSLTTKDPEYILQHTSKFIQENLHLVDSIVSWQLVSPSGTATIKDQYFVDNANPLSGKVNHVKGQYSGDAYAFVFQPRSDETYVVNYTTAAYKEGTNMLVCLVLGKEEGEWKIQALQIGGVEFGDKNAIDYMQLGDKYHNEGNVAAAYLASSFSAMLARPASNMFVYDKEESIKIAFKKTTDAFLEKYPMPLFVEGLSPQPVISAVEVYVSNKVAYPMPMISYGYNKPVSSYEAANQQLHEQINKVLPGIAAITDQHRLQTNL